MTIDRIAPEGGITTAQLNAVTAAARLTCQEFAPFRISLGDLCGTRGVVSFAVTPVTPISGLATRFAGRLCRSAPAPRWTAKR